jgi:hypothetical protein
MGVKKCDVIEVGKDGRTGLVRVTEVGPDQHGGSRNRHREGWTGRWGEDARTSPPSSSP